MGDFQYKAGLGNVGSYQVSGIPYVTGALTVPSSASAPLEIVFPSITQRIHIHNNDPTNPIRVGFSAAGVSGSNARNYWLVENQSTTTKLNDYIELRVKTDRIYLSSNAGVAVTNVFVAAELTGIILDFNLAQKYSGSVGVG